MSENIRFLHQCVLEAVVDVSSGHIAPLNDEQQGEILQGQWDGQVQSVVIGFSAEGVHGSLVLCCREDFLTHTLPRTLKKRLDVVLIPDWFGELSNLILGRLQRKLLNYLPYIDIFPPSVAEMPMSILDRYSERYDTKRDWVGREGALMCIQSCATFDESFVWRPLAKVTTLDPGQVLFLKNRPQDVPAKPNVPSGPVMTQFQLNDHGLTLVFQDGAQISLPLAANDRAPRVLAWQGTEISISAEENGKIQIQSSEGISFRLSTQRS